LDITKIENTAVIKSNTLFGVFYSSTKIYS